MDQFVSLSKIFSETHPHSSFNPNFAATNCWSCRPQTPTSKPECTTCRYLELGRLSGCEGETRSREGGHPDGISAFIRRDPREPSLHTHTPAAAMEARKEAAVCMPEIVRPLAASTLILDFQPAELWGHVCGGSRPVWGFLLWQPSLSSIPSRGWRNYNLLVCSPVHGRVGHFRFAALTNKAVMISPGLLLSFCSLFSLPRGRFPFWLRIRV